MTFDFTHALKEAEKKMSIVVNAGKREKQRKQSMTNIVVDVEADGPVPGMYSMVSFGAVIVEPTLTKTFYGQCRPIVDEWIPEALAISGHSREETLTFPEPADTMAEFAKWIKENTTRRPLFWADNNGFDFAFINYYFHRFHGSNPFGWSSNNVKSFYKGVKGGDMYANFRKLKKTKHTHHPVDDAMGVAEAMLAMKKIHNLKINLV